MAKNIKSIKVATRLGMRSAEVGFTYLVLLLWMGIAGVGLAALGDHWYMIGKRAREAELVWCGDMYKKAIYEYIYSGPHGVKVWPKRLDDLLEDRRTGKFKRHLRELYKDPVNGGGNWGLIRDVEGGIHGVYSLSDEAPVSQVLGVKKYRDMKFEALIN